MLNTSMYKSAICVALFIVLIYPIWFYNKLFDRFQYHDSEASFVVPPFEISAVKLIEKTIQPGNHTWIPGPESRIGPNGEVGYIHDPKFLIKNPAVFRGPDHERESLCFPPGMGPELKEGASNLKKIRNYMETSKKSRDVKLFCSIYTYSGGVNYTNAIRETWGKKCDGLLFASSESNLTTGHTHFPSNSENGFERSGLIQRTRSILAYLYDNFLGEYDYFHLSGDDVYIMVENMKEFLASDKVQEWDKVPNQYMFAGFWMHNRKQDGIITPEGWFYLGGGSGYTLSRKALKAYVEGPLQTYKPTKEGMAEDVHFSSGVRTLTKKFIDTRDSAGAHRYHQLAVERHAKYPDTDYGYATMLIKRSLLHMERNFSFPYVVKDDYISNSSITFHYLKSMHIRRYELLLYKDYASECG